MRKSSYITGLDEILCGGFVGSSSILIAGETGTGKTNLCIQSLFEAAKNGETCTYISLLSESEDKILATLSSFSFFDQDVLDSGKLSIHSIDSDIICKGDFSLFEYINENVLNSSPSRVVIDPVTVLEEIDSTFEERQLRGCELRTFVQNLFFEFEERNIILMVTGEIPETAINISKWSYIADTVLFLEKKLDGNNLQRHMEIIKNRCSGYIPGKHAYTITADGIKLIQQ
ncbi:ATPase domain-containing protein [Methanolobus sp. ZRKC3]|uniref:RAD55 family ATPase n=1 Tax=Methanolobus sp. ZRKC3 TaxID=3125786 RepID=UPI0032568DB8